MPPLSFHINLDADWIFRAPSHFTTHFSRHRNHACLTIFLLASSSRALFYRAFKSRHSTRVPISLARIVIPSCHGRHSRRLSPFLSGYYWEKLFVRRFFLGSRSHELLAFCLVNAVTGQLDAAAGISSQVSQSSHPVLTIYRERNVDIVPTSISRLEVTAEHRSRPVTLNLRPS